MEPITPDVTRPEWTPMRSVTGRPSGMTTHRASSCIARAKATSCSAWSGAAAISPAAAT